jgi:hypothetical protein
MADFTKMKGRRSSLGAPPPAAEASPNLKAPETAPSPPVAPRLPVKAPPKSESGAPAGEGARPRDGRSARRTGRTLQFATRVSPEFDQRLRDIAAREGRLLVQVLEDALDAYEQSKR